MLYTMTLAPSPGTTGSAVVVTVTPGGAVSSGTVTLTPSGCGLTVAQTINFSGSAAVTASFTPTTAGTLTITSTNSAALTDPSVATDTIMTPIGGTIPAASDVRFGVAVGSATGLLRVPAAAQVQAGVLIDATTGTFVGSTSVSPTDYNAVQTACTAALTAFGKTGYALAAGGFDAIIIESNQIPLNARQAISIIASEAAGTAGVDTFGNMTIKSVGGTITRISATTLASGRTANIIPPV